MRIPVDSSQKARCSTINSRRGRSPIFPYLSLLFQGSEAAAGGREERLQLQLQGVKLLNADTIIFWAAKHGCIPGTQLHMFHRFEVVVFKRGAVLQLTHGAVWWDPAASHWSETRTARIITWESQALVSGLFLLLLPVSLAYTSTKQ